MLSRRPAPTIVLTATVATVVVLPLGIDSTPGSTSIGESPNTAATRLNQQPLPALGPGVTIREVSQHEPFSMVALTGTDLTGTSARVRAKHADGSWGPWYHAEHETPQESLDNHGRGGPLSGPDGTDPVFVGNTTTVQIAVTRPALAPATAPPISDTPAKPGLGYLPATAEQPFAQNISAVLISPPRTPVDAQWTPPAAIIAPGQPPSIIPRSQWGATEANRCISPADGTPVRAAVVHHTAGSNDYAPQDSAAIVRSIYAYHTRTLGWCDIGYNALVDKYGQVFEGRAGGIIKPVQGTHAGGFNRNTWGVAMLGTFDDAPPPPIQLRTVGRLLGWRLGLDRADPRGAVQLTSAGGSYTHFVRGVTLTLPTILSHRDVDNTECPGNAAYAALDEIRDIAARFNEPPSPEDLARSMEGGAIHARWQELGEMDSMLGAPTSPEAAADGLARYATFEHGAMYWSPQTGAEPVTGAIYDAWALLGYERGALGLPTSAEIQEPEWVGQNFQHGTLNFDRASGAVTRVIDGFAEILPPTPPDGPPVQLERFSPVVNPAR
ncbi:MAG: N-acetylmuramoyl-L-alanine amidase [Mycobacterium sp.]